MSAKIKRFLAFSLSMAAWAFVWWLAGYNFDRRGPDIAYFFAIAILASVLVAVCFKSAEKP